MVMQKEKLNKSKSYILPLVDTAIDLKYVEDIANTYIVDNTSPENLIILKYKNKNKIILDKEYINTIINNILFLSNQEDDEFLYFSLRIPKRFNREFKLFIEGRYSEFGEPAKQIIINFLTTHFKSSYQTIELVKAILYREERLRKQLSKELNMYIPANYELSSKIDLELERLKI